MVFEIDRSPSTGVEIKNEWSYTSTLSVCPHDVDRDNLTYILCFIIERKAH
jgi:hypothetical protein